MVATGSVDVWLPELMPRLNTLAVLWHDLGMRKDDRVIRYWDRLNASF